MEAFGSELLLELSCQLHEAIEHFADEPLTGFVDQLSVCVKRLVGLANHDNHDFRLVHWNHFQEDRLFRAHVVVSNRVCMCVSKHWNKKVGPIRQAGRT